MCACGKYTVHPRLSGPWLPVFLVIRTLTSIENVLFHLFTYPNKSLMLFARRSLDNRRRTVLLA